MDTRRLLSSAALYGLADVAVMAVGGFLLLPLYTRSLSQSEFGHFVAVRTNIDILTYLLHFGLPSAVARLYFDHRKLDQQKEFLSSIVCFFFVLAAALSVVFGIWGEALWKLLSPTTPSQPYLPFSVAIAAMGFLSAVSIMWLRVEHKALPVVALQVSASVVLAALASVNLVTFEMGLPGILLALLVSAIIPALALPVLFGTGFRFAIRRKHIAEALHYAAPVLVGYVAYFFLNRISTLLLQRHVSAAELAVFGLAQQLAMIVGIASTSFGMALQPAVFASDATMVNQTLRRACRMLTLLMVSVTTVLILFASELVRVVAPENYRSSLGLLLTLIVANFTTSFTLLSDSALMYHRRPKTSVGVSIAGALAATALGTWLIPLYHGAGAAASLAGAFAFRMLLSQWMARRATGQSQFGTILASMTTAVALAFVATAVEASHLGFAAALSVKLTTTAIVFSALYLLYRKA